MMRRTRVCQGRFGGFLYSCIKLSGQMTVKEPPPKKIKNEREAISCIYTIHFLGGN